MNDNCYHFQISVDEFNLPQQIPRDDLKVTRLFDKAEFDFLRKTFIEVFPEEIEVGKARVFRDLAIWQFLTIYVVKKKNSYIGFLITGIIEEAAYIFYLGVLAEYRSHGVATKLLEYYKNYLKERNIDEIQWKIKKDNFQCLEYVKRLGFELK